ncbi:hypothetical protein QL093DRAFT_2182933, partial [Fusarium oxysporum]
MGVLAFISTINLNSIIPLASSLFRERHAMQTASPGIYRASKTAASSIWPVFVIFASLLYHCLPVLCFAISCSSSAKISLLL